MSLNIYLYFDGQCRAAFDFYQQVFGGEFTAEQTFGDGPEEMQVPDDGKHLIMHISLPLGNSELMGSDTFPGDPTPQIVGNNFSVAVTGTSRAQCDEWFAALSQNGSVDMGLEETFWGSYFGRVTDQFGINWMIDFDLAAEQ